MSLIIFAVVGACAGLIAGLFGLGGGVVIVPVLIYTFAAYGINDQVATHLAIGTSLTCIIITASVSSWTHYQKRAIQGQLLIYMVPGILIGAWLGGVVASWLDGIELRIVFGLFLIFVSATMFWGVKDRQRPLPATPVFAGASGIIGILSSLFGIGGGSLSVPFMRLSGVPMAKAVATSAVLGLPIAISGAASFMVQGWNNELLPEWSLGYIYLPAFLGIVVCSAPASRVGAKLAHVLPAATLQRAFAILSLLIAVELLASALL